MSDLKAKTKVDRIYLTELLFADDAELVSESEHQLQFMLDILSEVTDAYGQEISIKKTEVMVVGNKRSESIESTTNITIKNITLNKVSNFKYLGNMQNSRANISCEISARIQRLAAAFNKLDNKIFSSSKMNLRVKIKSFVLSQTSFSSSLSDICHFNTGVQHGLQLQLMLQN